MWEDKEKPLNLAPIFDTLGMWNLNPGKDSIIYRMTSQRKKDQ